MPFYAVAPTWQVSISSDMNIKDLFKREFAAVRLAKVERAEAAAGLSEAARRQFMESLLDRLQSLQAEVTDCPGIRFEMGPDKVAISLGENTILEVVPHKGGCEYGVRETYGARQLGGHAFETEICFRSIDELMQFLVKRCASYAAEQVPERRDTSPEGQRDREYFGRLLDQLTGIGIDQHTARRELLTVWHGGGSKLLQQHGITIRRAKKR